MRRLYASVVFALLLGPVSLRAQEEPGALSLLPDGLMAVARMKGPAEIAKLFEKTNLGRMLAGPEIARLIGPDLEKMEHSLEEGLSQAGLDFAEAKKRALAYRGEITVGVGVLNMDALRGPIPDPSELGFWVALVLSPDGETDLPGLCRALEELAEKQSEGRLLYVKVEGRLFRGVMDDTFGVTLPAMVGSHLVLYMGTSLQKTIASGLYGEGRDRHALAKILAKSAFSCHLDLKAGVKLLDAFLEMLAAELAFDEEDDTTWQKVPRLVELLGLRALNGMTLTAGAEKECVRLDASLELNRGAEQGLFGMFSSEGAGANPLFDLVPLHKTGWGFGTLRMDRLYELLYRAVELFADEIEQRPAELETMFQDFFRVRLKEDLIDHLGSELITLDLSAEPDVEGMQQEEGGDPFLAGLLGGFPPACYGVSLKDPGAFGRSLETLLRSRGLHTARKTETYREMALQKLSFLGFPLYYAVTGRLFLVGPGEKGAMAMRAILDEEADRREGKPRAKMPEEVARRLALAPAGREGLAVQSIAALLKQILEQLKDEPDWGNDIIGIGGGRGRALPPNPFLTQFRSLATAIPPLFKEYRLEHMVSVSWSKEGRFTSSVIW